MSYVTDPIGDLLTRMRNAQMARKSATTAPWSRMKEQLLTLFKKEGWIADVKVVGDEPKKQLHIDFLPEKDHLELKRISKPGRRVYTAASDLKPVLQGYGTAVLTTSQGLMTDTDARSKKIGGEVLCTIA